MVMVWTYVIYLLLSVGLTVWVGYTLHKNGRLFLIDALKGNEKLADSVNHLLLVGFYLINIGFVSVALKYGGRVEEVPEAIEYLSTKVGIVLLVLGVMHFFNLFVLSMMRRRALQPERVVEALPVPSRRLREDREYIGSLRTRAVPVDENNPGEPQHR
jgi:hypothetical protein